jgi:hypothetical protein
MTSKAGYWLAPLPLLLGIAIAVWVGLSTAADIGNAFTRFVVPGAGTVALAKPGTYTIFHETQSVVDGRVYAVKDMPGMKVDVMPEAGGTAVPVTPASGHSTYTVGSRAGESMLEFTVAEPGRYRVTAAYPGGRDGPKTVLAISSGIMGTLFRGIAIVIGSILLGFALSLTLLLTTYFRRRRMLPAGNAPNWHSNRTPS